jgi:glycosyltransferase involved in cell wall biosynthesis
VRHADAVVWAIDKARLWRERRWVKVRDVAMPDPLPNVPLHGLVVTWNEADIVGISVRNALEQGCDVVHVLDNGSPDDTVAVAKAAGATFEGEFLTDTFDLEAGQARVEEVVERVSREAGVDHLWWLYFDADELVEGPHGSTVRHMIDGLDRSFRVVGSRTMNHYPRRDHPLEEGQDPRFVATNVQERMGIHCRRDHWKHPLVRWDAQGPSLVASNGYHIVHADRRLTEPRLALVTHHYPYRAQSATVRRLERLRPRLEGHGWAVSRRESNADAIYREAYDEVDTYDMVGPKQTFGPVPCPPVRTE